MPNPYKINKLLRQGEKEIILVLELLRGLFFHKTTFPAVLIYICREHLKKTHNSFQNKSSKNVNHGNT